MYKLRVQYRPVTSDAAVSLDMYYTIYDQFSFIFMNYIARQKWIINTVDNLLIFQIYLYIHIFDFVIRSSDLFGIISYNLFQVLTGTQFYLNLQITHSLVDKEKTTHCTNFICLYFPVFRDKKRIW